MKFIREGRFGPPKAGKTYSVVTSYPKPMIVLELDPGGLSGIDNVTFIEPKDLEAWTKKSTADLPPIVAIDLAVLNETPLSVLYVPRPDTKTFPATVDAINKLHNQCPWKTVVLDTVTSLSDSIWGHQSAVNTAALADPRKWAGNIGMKVKQVFDVMVNIKAHVVVIFHSEIEKDEDTKLVRELPMCYSKLRQFLSAIFDQFLYAVRVNGQPKIKTVDEGLLFGVHCRWPKNLPTTVGPLFTDIYGNLDK